MKPSSTLGINLSVPSTASPVRLIKGTVVGTEDYIAPEVLCEEPQGPPSDLFSLGVIIFMMLTGQRSPFKGASQFDTL